jgi:hypothetical protein
MKRLVQVLLLCAAIGHFGSESSAKIIISFGMCEIEISDFADNDLTQISQTAVVRDTNTGFVRTIETYKLTVSSLIDFPLPGIDTFVLRDWSGGMTCCHFDFVITHKRSSGRTHFQIISSGRGEAEIQLPGTLSFVDNKPALEVLDSFWIPDQVWWPRWRLCHASSPVPARVILFDPDLLLWEDIRPNHLPGYFEKKSAATIEAYRLMDPNKDQDRFSLAIEATYYAHMAGRSNAKLDRILHHMVPKEHRDKKNKSIAKIRERIIERANDFQAVEFWLADSENPQCSPIGSSFAAHMGAAGHRSLAFGYIGHFVESTPMKNLGGPKKTE